MVRPSHQCIGCGSCSGPPKNSAVQVILRHLAQLRLHTSFRSVQTLVLCAGQHVPAEAAAAPSKQAPSTLGRVLGTVGNLAFYGGLIGCTGFWASIYMYSLEDTHRMAAAAEEAEQRSPNVFAQAYAAAVCQYRDARVWCDQKLTEMTGEIRFPLCA